MVFCMEKRRAANPVLLFIYLLCLYVTIGFPWNFKSGAIFGLNIFGFVIEPQYILILIILLPVYLLFGTKVRTLAMRQTLTVCWIISIAGALFLIGSIFTAGSRSIGFGWIIGAIIDIKTWFFLWMMPVTILYILERGFERWVRHLLISSACYCAMSIVISATRYGFGAYFLPELDVFGRVTMLNDIILVLVIPLAVGRLMDRGFSWLSIICLVLFLTKMLYGQGRTLMAMTAAITIITIIRSGSFKYIIIGIFAIVLGILFTVWTLPEQQRFGMISRLSGIGDSTAIYKKMLGTSNEIAIAEIKDSAAKMFFGAGLGTSLDLYGGAETENAVRGVVDNLWVTLLFKIGIVGLFVIGGPILYFCWNSARGRPRSNIDRVFKLWAFFIPFMSLRGSFLLWNVTNGVIWATLAAAAMLAEERRFAPSDSLLVDTDEYVSEELIVTEQLPSRLADGEPTRV
jgi:hypothetical protein